MAWIEEGYRYHRERSQRGAQGRAHDQSVEKALDRFERTMTEPIIPPESLRLGMGPFEDPELFASSGRETLDLARDLMSLLPSHRLLDLGCGCGRVSVPAMAFLDDSGSYAGLDIDPECIRWCSEKIEAQDGRFSFTYLDVQSESYNPQGTISPDGTVLPFPDGDFDRALVSSVFTHLTEAGTARYISELGRVLRPGGLVLASFLLMNGATESAVSAGTTSFEFRHPLGANSWTLDPSNPLDGVAVAEAWLRRLAFETGFLLDQTVYGTWRETLGWAVHHDWMVLRRASGEAV